MNKMIRICPKCGQEITYPDIMLKIGEFLADAFVRPERLHYDEIRGEFVLKECQKCQHCGYIWTPYDEANALVTSLHKRPLKIGDFCCSLLKINDL